MRSATVTDDSMRIGGQNRTATGVLIGEALDRGGRASAGVEERIATTNDNASGLSRAAEPPIDCRPTRIGL
jgi:hypothetical protein